MVDVLNELHIPHASPRQAGCTDCLRKAETGRQRHARGEVLARHRHAHAFATLVISGGYEEAGDSGLHRVHAGDVLFHCAHERHLDRMHATGADVPVLPLPKDWSGIARARVTDTDAVVRLAEGDVPAAVTHLLEHARSAVSEPHDWPDQLATDILANPCMSLTEWADLNGLHPGSVSRGFGQVFAISPKAFRLQARTHAALKLYRSTSLTASAIAHTCGFADQAHLSRSITALTGVTASQFREPTSRHRQAITPSAGATHD